MAGTIICYGDSNTYGYDPCTLMGDQYPEQNRWTGILEERNEVEDRESRHLWKVYSAHRKPDPFCLRTVKGLAG